MIDSWVESEALVERKDGASSIEMSTELWWLHRVVGSRVVVRANRYLLHLTVLLNNTYVDMRKQTETKTKLERGPMPSLMAALPNIGGALC